MFGLKFGAKKKPVEGVIVIVRLNARLQPVQRGEHFEDPLGEVLQDLGVGAVTGGGTQLADDGRGIDFCDIELSLTETSESAVQAIIAALEELGAPKGSKLIVEASGAETAFGAAEGLALFLNGTGLPDEVYAECDVNFVLEEADRLMGDAGKVKGFWEGPMDTALYCYGPSFEGMRAAIEPLLASYPLCAKARVEQIA
ncbi:MAG: hypothetical protein U5J99_13300 [Parvularculaceae bacterium]|nr:hypothetical protein [Parvularculaceae bacterium]